MNKRIIEKVIIDPSNLDLSNWPTVLEDKLSPKQHEIYTRRKKAIEMYIKNNNPEKEILEITGIRPPQLRKLIKRCIQEDTEGVIWGLRALIPFKRINSYRRKNKEKVTFSSLLDSNPEIKKRIDDLYFNKVKKEVTDKVIRVIDLHQHFLKTCRQIGIHDNEYPFNTDDKGQRSLYRYIEKLRNEHISKTAKRHGEDAARRARSTGIGELNNPIKFVPFQRVQFDGHRIDAIFTITWITPEGNEVTKTLERPWLLIIVDEATKLILGYYISLYRQYSAEDVLYCIQSAIVPKKLKDFTIEGLHYPKDIGFASAIIPEAQWAAWEVFCYDNAKPNLSKMVKNKLIKNIGCAIDAGAVEMPERRNLIESLFGTLEDNGYHRLPNTTGSNPSDPRRKEPEKNAIRFKISVEHLEELTEIIVAKYNTTPNEGLYGDSPIECLKKYIERGVLPNLIPEEKRNEVTFLTHYSKCTIKGNIKQGKRPFIYYEGVIYRSDVLSHSAALIGTQLDLLINIDDLRTIRAYLPDGSEFGLLTAHGKWGVTPHSLKIRKIINKLKAEKKINFTMYDNPLEIYNQYLSSQLQNSKKERNKLAELNRHQARYQKEDINTKMEGEENTLDKTSESNLINKKEKTRKVTETLFF